jgi:hypothetical protein
MQKGIQESNHALALWQRVILDGRISKFARSYRIKLQMPLDGFNHLEEYNNWYKKNINNTNTIKHLTAFIKESKSIIPYDGIIDDIDMEIILIEYLCDNNINHSYFKKAKYSGMQIKTIKDSKLYNSRIDKYVGHVKDGVYIKLKNFTSLDEISRYIEDNKSLIKKTLSDYALSMNLLKPKKFKISSNFERDKKILNYNQYSLKELQERSGMNYKDKNTLISEIMKEFGPKVKGGERTNHGIVKIVRERSKLKKRK